MRISKARVAAVPDRQTRSRPGQRTRTDPGASGYGIRCVADNEGTYEKEVVVVAPRNEPEVRHEQSVGRPARASTTTPTAWANVADTQAYAVGDETREGLALLFALFPQWACEAAHY
jgi:hypothetical protein